MKKATAFVCRRPLRDKRPLGCAAYGMQILATVSQESLTLMARFAGCMPAAIEPPHVGRAICGRQILVTVSRTLAVDHGRGFNAAEVARVTDGREVGLAQGQA